MKQRPFFYILCVLLPVATALRAWQLAVTVEPSGFYSPAYVTLCTWLEAGLFCLLAVYWLAARLALRKTAPAPAPGKPTAAAALAVAVLCIPQGMSDWQATEGVLARGVLLAASICLAVSFVVLASYWFKAQTPPTFAFMAPVITELARLVVYYAGYNGIAKLSDNVFTVLFCCAFLCFLLASLRVFTLPDSPCGSLVGAGAATAVLGAAVTLSHWFAGEGTLRTLGLGGCLYAVTLLAHVAFRAKPGEAPTEDAERDDQPIKEKPKSKKKPRRQPEEPPALPVDLTPADGAIMLPREEEEEDDPLRNMPAPTPGGIALPTDLLAEAEQTDPAPAPKRKKKAARKAEAEAEAKEKEAVRPPKPAAKPQPKVEPKPQPQPEAKPEPKPQPQPQPKAEVKPEVKPEPQPEPKPEPAPQSTDTSDPAALVEQTFQDILRDLQEE